MDKIDKQILKRLQENARVTISVLSSEISLSMPAISERLKKLEASGVIKQYTAILNPELMDKNLTALVNLGFDNPSKADAFKQFVLNEADIKECFYITGDFDYCLKVVTHNTQTLENLLTRIKEQAGVTKTQTIVVLSSIVDRPSVVLE
ncbi:MAG: Lrp/AsnC family transcriptional regulator [Anaerovibrio sp.]|jgi:Lrp/AsnC family leucine-responsive transcriptional regulator|nr:MULTISPECIES: Lrp/AsnC family transcriptional regulator [Anaerovibrio]MBO6246401.1 Lrp/AsnC family transcriptional regulator [Anaerovibrio sp.]MBQ1856470.1 Lrp/AsnC family transcriptional regulator [Anaerovibrio sp.]MBR1697487.1 Lrp/AsnC family transcriptional regulator [Anaerovibrio sp.]